jgi:CSLREA domain-containing protein
MSSPAWFRALKTLTPSRPRRLSPPPCRPAVEVLEDRRTPALITVNTLADVVAPDAFTSLREAITAANTMPGDDTIDFSVTGTINLTATLPDLDSNLAIQGPGPASLAVRPTGGSFRLFRVRTGRTVSLSGLALTDGLASLGDGDGGGIHNAGTLTVTNCTL